MNLFFHIGYPKTASTTLQQAFFCNMDEIDFLGKPYVNNVIHDCVYYLKHDKSSRYLAELKKITESIKSRKKSALISAEEILTLEEYYVEESVSQHKAFLIDRFSDLKTELRRNGIDLKLILVIRNQTDIILSTMAHRFKNNIFYVKKYENTNFTGEILKNKNDNFLQYLFYSDLICGLNDKGFVLYEDLIVLTFEDFVEDKNKFFYDLSNYLGLGENYMRLIQDSHYNKKSKMNGNYQVRKNLKEMIKEYTFFKLKLKNFWKKHYRLYKVLGKMSRVLDFLKKVKVSESIISIDDYSKKEIYKTFFKSNQKLERLLNIKLNEKYFRNIGKDLSEQS